jgi:cell division protein FtsN
MLPGKLLVTGVLATLLVGGCVQKKPQSRKNTTQPPKTVSTPVLKDTTDIFDEFYKDEAASKSTPEKASGKTFSTVSSSKKKISVPSGQIVENGPYVLQVSTVRSKKLADKVASQLEGMGFPSYVAEVQSPTPSLSGTFYRVRVGGFSSGPSARAFGESTLKDAGYDFWVDKRANDNVGIDGSGMGSGGSSYSGSSSSYSSGSTDYSSSANTYSSTPAATQPAAAAPAPVKATPAPAAQPAAAKPAGTGSVPDTSGWDSAW